MKTTIPKFELTDIDYLRFSGLVREKSGIEMPEIRRPDLEKAVIQSMTELSISDPGSLYAFLTENQENNDCLGNIVSRITVGETYFFRNFPHFEALKSFIFPEIIAKKQEAKQLRLWSAGCASGEEAYSLAILIRKLLPIFKDWQVLILATDINKDALIKAQKGEYGSWSFRNVPAKIKDEYFYKNGSIYTIRPEIKRMVTFQHHNLVEVSYPSIRTYIHSMDLILCRNVMIYFNEDTTRRVVERLHSSLNDNGWLIVAPAETSQKIFRQFLFRNFSDAICYQKTNANLLSGQNLPRNSVNIDQGIPVKISKKSSIALLDKQFSKEDISPNKYFGNMNPTKFPLKRNYLSKPPDGIQTALNLFNSGFIKESIDKLIMLAESNWDDFWSPYWLAKIYAGRLEFDNGEYWIDIAIEREPVFAPAYYLRSLILQGLGMLDQSLEAVRRCLYIDPEFLLGHIVMADLLRQFFYPKRAKNVLKNLEKLIFGKAPEDLVPEGDGMTIALLQEFISTQKELLE